MTEPREKTLQELNLEQRRADIAIRDTHEQAGEAAKAAVIETLAEKRPDGRRTRKDVRPVAP